MQHTNMLRALRVACINESGAGGFYEHFIVRRRRSVSSPQLR